jgi:phage baseplate assembly protein W
MSEKAISLPFSLDAYGKILSTNEQTKIWADRVLSVLGTLSSERVMDAQFGTPIPSYAFESLENAEALIPGEVAKAFSRWLSNLTLQDTIVLFDKQAGQVLVEVIYQLPNDEVRNTVIALAAISGDQLPYQESL